MTHASTASSTSSGPELGKGTGATTTRQPRSAAAYSRTLRVALYSWSVTSSSEPAASGTERSTELIAVVTLRTKASPATGAFRSRASSCARADQRRCLAVEEARRLALELVAQRLLLLEHGPRARPEGAVIQEGDRGVERPVARERVRIAGRNGGFLAIRASGRAEYTPSTMKRIALFRRRGPRPC